MVGVAEREKSRLHHSVVAWGWLTKGLPSTPLRESHAWSGCWSQVCKLQRLSVHQLGWVEIDMDWVDDLADLKFRSCSSGIDIRFCWLGDLIFLFWTEMSGSVAIKVAGSFRLVVVVFGGGKQKLPWLVDGLEEILMITEMGYGFVEVPWTWFLPFFSSHFLFSLSLSSFSLSSFFSSFLLVRDNSPLQLVVTCCYSIVNKRSWLVQVEEVDASPTILRALVTSSRCSNAYF